MTEIITHYVVVSDDAPEEAIREAVRIKAKMLEADTNLHDIRVVRESELRQVGRAMTQLTNPTNEQELRDSDTAYDIAMTCYHAGSLAQRGKTIHPGTVREWTDRITAHTNAEIAKVLDRLEIEMPSERNTLVGDAYQRTFCNEYNKALKEVSKVIQAERAKLKEVK